MTISYQAEREQVALACRMLAVEGLAQTTLGHVSLRVDDRHFLIRARRASERGLLFTTADDIALTDLDGTLHPGEPPISLPAELPIHSALLAARPECAAVLHAIDVHILAGLTVTCAQIQRPLTEIGAGDYQDLPAFGQEYYDQVWRCYAAKAGRMGIQHG